MFMKHLLLTCAFLAAISHSGLAKQISEENFSCDGIRYTDFGHTVAGLESNETTNVVIPSTVKYGDGEATVEGIMIDAFRDCPKLESLTIAGSIMEFYSSDFGQIPDHPFSGTPDLKELIFDSGEGYINLPYPFVEDSWNLDHLIINRPFNSIFLVNNRWENHPVFEGIRVNTVELFPDDVPSGMESLPDNVFQKSDIKTLVVGPALASLGVNTFIDMQQSINNILIKESKYPLRLYGTVVTTEDAGNGLGTMWSTNYPSFDESAISGLNYVDMERQLDILPQTKFFSSVRELNIGQGIKEIQSNAFSEAEHLEVVRISEGIENIGYGAFGGCRELKEVYLPSSIEEIASNLFTDCSSLTKVLIPFGIKKIGSGAFMMCQSLKEIEFPSSLKAIEPYSFVGSSLTSLEIPESVEIICESAFSDCPLEYIRVFREEPLKENEVSPLAFDCYQTAQLIVPRVSINAYMETIPWSFFERITSEPWIKCMPSDLLLTEGETKTLSFEIMDVDNPTQWDIYCEPENTEIVTVDPITMEITGIKEGTTLLKVTATFNETAAITGTFTVTVKADSGVDSILIDPDEIVTVYSINGMKVGTCRYSDLEQSISSGLYIIHTSTGITKKEFLH